MPAPLPLDMAQKVPDASTAAQSAKMLRTAVFRGGISMPFLEKPTVGAMPHWPPTPMLFPF